MKKLLTFPNNKAYFRYAKKAAQQMKRIVSAIQKRGTGNEGVITVYETKGALPANWPEHLDGFEKDLRLVLEENHLDPKAHS